MDGRVVAQDAEGVVRQPVLVRPGIGDVDVAQLADCGAQLRTILSAGLAPGKRAASMSAS